MIDGQIWCYFSAGDKNHSFHTSFNPADCHMDKLAEKLLEDGQFSTHVAVPASWRQISTPNHLKWFKVYEAWPVKSIISSCYIMNFIFVISSGFWGFGFWLVVWIMIRCYFTFCVANRMMPQPQKSNVATLMLCEDDTRYEYLNHRCQNSNSKLLDDS